MQWNYLPPSFPSRTMSAFVNICACSRRGRKAVTLAPFNAASNASNTIPFARSPTAWTFYYHHRGHIGNFPKVIIGTYHLPAIAQVLRYDIKQDLRIKTHESICGRVVSIRFVELKFELSARDFRLPLRENIHGSASSSERPYKIVNSWHIIKCDQKLPSPNILMLRAFRRPSPAPMTGFMVSPEYGRFSSK